MSIACPVLEMRAMAALMIPQPSSTYGINGDAFLKQGWDRTQPLTVDRISNHILYNYALPGALPSCPTHVQEAQVASRSYTERALATIRGFQPAAHFPVSEEWGFLIEDNLEFYLKVPEERFIGGVLKSSQLLNTTTSEYAAPDVLCPPVLCPPV